MGNPGPSNHWHHHHLPLITLKHIVQARKQATSSVLRGTFDFGPDGVGCTYLVHHITSPDVLWSSSSTVALWGLLSDVFAFPRLWLIHPHFRRKIVCSTGSSCVARRSSLLLILSGQYILIILLRNLLNNTCRLSMREAPRRVVKFYHDSIKDELVLAGTANRR